MSRHRIAQLTRTVGPLAAGLAVLHLCYAVTFRVSTSPYAAVNAWWCLAMAVLLAGVAALAFAGRVAPAWAEPLVVGIAVTILAEAVGHLTQTGDPKETTNVVLVLIASAAVLASVWSFVLVLAVTVAALLYGALTVESAGSAYFGYAIATGVTLATLIFVTRRTMNRRLVEARAELRHMAVVDELTGLHNRRGFHVLAEQAMLDADRAGIPITVLFVDVEGLRTINARFGREVGDAVLQETASLLRSTFRSADVVARLGDDDFCVLLPAGAPGVRYRDRLRSQVIEANSRDDRTYTLSLSIGEARYDPAQPVPIEELLLASDEARCADKHARTPRR